MKVLMKKDLRKVGKRGEIISVSDGYGANYLIPNGYAVLYTEEAKKNYAIELEEERKQEEIRTNQAIETAAKLETITLNFQASKGRDGNMIGTISFKKISQTLEEQHGIKITKGMYLDKDLIINGFGKTDVEVELFKGVKATVHILVTLKEKK